MTTNVLRSAGGRRERIILVLAAALFAPLLLPAQADAIPAWARRYGVTCNACHTGGGWKLNRNGQEFLFNGHQFPGDEAPEMALSHSTSLAYKYRIKGGETSRETFEAHAFSVYSGGALENGFSYFTELYFHENSGTNTGPGDFGDYGRSKLAESYIQYRKGSDSNFMTFRFGQIQPQILHIHNMGARTSQGRPSLWSAKFNADNEYTAFSRQYGVDANYFAGPIAVSAGVLNGTGKLLNAVDNNDYKDLFGSAAYFLGTNGSNVGVVYYNGKYPAGTYNDQYSRIIAVADYVLSQMNFKAAYMTGQDEVDAAGTTVDGNGYYLEGFYWLDDYKGFYGRYENVDPDTDVSDNESNGFTVGATWRPMEYGRFVLDLSKYGPTDARKFKFTLEFNFMW